MQPQDYEDHVEEFAFARTAADEAFDRAFVRYSFAVVLSFALALTVILVAKGS